jgi:hypothetical protein
MAKNNQVALTLRLDAEENRRFAALLILNGETANDVLRTTVRDYIKMHEHKLNV